MLRLAFANLFPQIINPDDQFLSATPATPFLHFDGWNNWETWEAPADVVQLSPFYKAGHDKDGLPRKSVACTRWSHAFNQMKYVCEEHYVNHSVIARVQLRVYTQNSIQRSLIIQQNYIGYIGCTL